MRAAGTMTVLIVLAVKGLATYAFIISAGLLHPLIADIITIVLLYTTFAARDLMRHSLDVYRKLKSGNLEKARQKVSLLVGRETEILDEGGIVRATVESVTENTVDGVTVLLFFAFLTVDLQAQCFIRL
jgi:adenosylcobinamide-phosphate synthase